MARGNHSYGADRSGLRRSNARVKVARPNSGAAGRRDRKGCAGVFGLGFFGLLFGLGQFGAQFGAFRCQFLTGIAAQFRPFVAFGQVSGAQARAFLCQCGQNHIDIVPLGRAGSRWWQAAWASGKDRHAIGGQRPVRHGAHQSAPIQIEPRTGWRRRWLTRQAAVRAFGFRKRQCHRVKRRHIDINRCDVKIVQRLWQRGRGDHRRALPNPRRGVTCFGLGIGAIQNRRKRARPVGCIALADRLSQSGLAQHLTRIARRFQRSHIFGLFRTAQGCHNVARVHHGFRVQ